jgi:hypothetical protein
MSTVEFSRPAAVAAILGDEGQRFLDKRVLLCGDTEVLDTLSGYESFRASFLLLIRICQHVAVAVPKECEALRADINALARRMVPDRQLQNVDPSGDAFQDFDAILSIGIHGRTDLPWTVINADGWVARVSSRGADLPKPTISDNAIAAIGAACLGTGEVFKRLIRLKSDRGELLDATSFSLWTYSVSEDLGPPLDAFVVDILIIGCGAIGSGVGYVLSRCPASGRALTLDPQSFGKENFGTSIAVGPSDYGPKAEVIAELLKSKLTAKGVINDIAGFSVYYDGTFPDMILTGLDEIDPRHQAQELWPALIIDGAVGGELSCQVSCHPWSSDIACLLCLFKKPPAYDLAELNARATGLPNEIANDPDAIITDEIIAQADPGRRPWLNIHRGKPLCSITSELVLKFLSTDTHRGGFAPAVPFLSCFSACMMVTELVRVVTTGKTFPEPRYQMNLLWGPRRGQHYEESRHKDCICVGRRENISRWRAQRSRR